MKKLNAVQIGILALGLATGLIHLLLLNWRMLQFKGSIDLLFTLNGLGFLVLLAAYFLPLSWPLLRTQFVRRTLFVSSWPGLLRWVFIVYTAVTIAAWIPVGERSALGILTKLVEVGLIACLWADRRQ